MLSLLFLLLSLLSSNCAVYSFTVHVATFERERSTTDDADDYAGTCKYSSGVGDVL